MLEMCHKQCVKKEKLETKKTIAMIWLHLDELKNLARTGGFRLDPGFVRGTGTR